MSSNSGSSNSSIGGGGGIGGSSGIIGSRHNHNIMISNSRKYLDQLFAIDSIVSIIFGIVTLLIPHFIVEKLFVSSSTTSTGNEYYNHSVHEVVRLYSCVRISYGYILWYIRYVDDGIYRKHVCEGLFICYIVQALVVIRAQFTDRHTILNYIAIILLLLLSSAYGTFRYQKGGNLIKVYELPSTTGGTIR